MSKSKLYTRSGDKGETSLVGGQRVNKANSRIDAYGELDHLNSQLGLAINSIDDKEVVTFLRKIQNDIFVLGSNFATKLADKDKFKIPTISKEDIDSLESEIDRIDAILDPMKYFILPGGSIQACHLHLCRTITRKVERKAVQVEDAQENELSYINRLSDYFFALARYFNKLNGQDDIPWIP